MSAMAIAAEDGTTVPWEVIAIRRQAQLHVSTQSVYIDIIDAFPPRVSIFDIQRI